MFLEFKYFAALLLTFYFSRKKGVERQMKDTGMCPTWETI